MDTSIPLRDTGLRMFYPVINGLLFNLAWFAIVATQSPVIAPLAAGLYLLVHFWVMGEGRLEAMVIVQVTLIGLVVDRILFMAGVFTIDGAAAAPPLWMLCIWPVLATTLMHAFSGLQQRPLVAAVAGGIGGAASFIAGTRLTDVAFGSELFGPIIMATLWAILFPLLLQIPRANRHYWSKDHD